MCFTPDFSCVTDPDGKTRVIEEERSQAVVVHASNSTTQEAETGSSL